MIFVSLEKYKYAVALFLLIICGLLYNHYYFAVSDHTYKIPFLKAIFNPELYARDITVSMKSYYTTYFHLLVWPFERVFGFEIAFFIIYVLTQLLFYISIYLLTNAIFKNRMTGLIAVALLLFPKEVLGGIATFDPLVEERSVAFSLLLFGIYLLIVNKYILSSCLFAFAASIHFVTFVNIGIFVIVFFLINFLINKKEKKQLAKNYLSFCVLLFLGTLPFVVKSTLFSPQRDLFATVDPVWLKMILVRSAHHFYPNYKSFLFFTLASVLIVLFFFIIQTFDEKRIRKGLVLYASSIISMGSGCILGCIFIKVYPSSIGVQLSFFRASYMFVILTYIMLAYILGKILNRYIIGIVVFCGFINRTVLFIMLCAISGGLLILQHVGFKSMPLT